MLYRVEMADDGDWRPVGEAVEAKNHHQAVARTSDADGIYRAQAHRGEDYLYFYVPRWGPPEPFLD